MQETEEILQKLGISSRVIRLVKAAEEAVEPLFRNRESIKEYNQYKVLSAMQQAQLSDHHFQWYTGYGYNDPGREKTEEIFASVFGAEDALVRPNIVNGTHALSLALAGNLFAEDSLLCVTGAPYDTLHQLIGLTGEYPGSLMKSGVHYRQINLKPDNSLDQQAINQAILEKKPTMVYFQRSTGYSFRPALSLTDLESQIQQIKHRWPEIIIMVDNCYGEFLDLKEPIELGADLIAGSLIKNPGGGIALTGGYVVGKAELVERAASRLTAPGIGKECGLTFGTTRTVLQGLFLAPMIVCEAVKGAILAAKVFDSAGYQVQPTWNASRSDIIQGVQLNTPEAVKAFCQGVQAAAPVDHHVTPIAWDMPGYQDPVIMAAGAFIQGSSIELSADGPMRPPYQVYFQGGLTYPHAKFGVMKALDAVIK
ncbi:aminotransferase class I/II-fold pyridoxal phosphate-dependent enzyme [Anoxynatronum sibiricum]|uniref:Methionine gamma-lyase family protein n=1 Tax=Anoxynatronum sibiricum TaxID=210623 RepID=A0ABU9VQ91_9CLOT